MQIKDSIAFVTGANRGFGLSLVHEVLADEITQKVKQGLVVEPAIYLAPVTR